MAKNNPKAPEVNSKEEQQKQINKAWTEFRKKTGIIIGSAIEGYEEWDKGRDRDNTQKKGGPTP
ncbi:MAG: hypothetical protein K0U37_00720 [Gammaproteobacteria bacterium]|nr:hypothetical protein [Gammaproteobacteria bacterium]